jgi:perosamine synthetase
MITTDDQRVADLCRSMRNQGRAAGGGWLAHARLGYNYRLSDINAALGLAQLRRIEEIIARRSLVRRWYIDGLSAERCLVLQQVVRDVEVSWFVFVVRLADSYGQKERDAILTALTERGIGCSNYFVPIHLQPFYVERFGYKPGDFPVCEAVAARTIALPFHHELTEADVDRVCTELQRLL